MSKNAKLRAPQAVRGGHHCGACGAKLTAYGRGGRRGADRGHRCSVVR